jgi:transposase
MTKAEQRYLKRAEVVEAIQRGEPPCLVARVFGTSERNVFNWLARYRSGGWHALEEGKRSGRPRKLSGQMMRWLYDAITMGDPEQQQMPFCLWTLNVIRTMLKKHHGVALSKSAVSRMLKQMGLSPQKPIYRSYKQDPRELEKYLGTTFPALRRKAKRLGAEIYFIDEAALRSDHHHGTTWGAIGETPVVEDSGDRFGIKMISAVSPRGDMRFSVIEGRMNSDKFIVYLKKLRQDAGRPIMVIADNASYHTSKKTQRFAKESKGEITLAYLPRYAPELNPDEQVWNHAKRALGQKFIETKDEMKRMAINALRSIQKRKQLVRAFFQLETTQYAAA